MTFVYVQGPNRQGSSRKCSTVCLMIVLLPDPFSFVDTYGARQVHVLHPSEPHEPLYDQKGSRPHFLQGEQNKNGSTPCSVVPKLRRYRVCVRPNWA